MLLIHHRQALLGTTSVHLALPCSSGENKRGSSLTLAEYETPREQHHQHQADRTSGPAQGRRAPRQQHHQL
jgi:hypothetical protein